MADGPDKTDELYPIAVLIDELKVPVLCCGLGGNLLLAHLLMDSIA